VERFTPATLFHVQLIAAVITVVEKG